MFTLEVKNASSNVEFELVKASDGTVDIVAWVDGKRDIVAYFSINDEKKIELELLAPIHDVFATDENDWLKVRR